MPRQSKQQANKKSAAKKHDGPAIVQKFRYFGKASLAAYPDEDGVPLYLGKNHSDEKEFFAKGAIAATRDKSNCEMLHRLGMGLCLAASSFDNGCKIVEKRIPNFDGSSSVEDMKKKFDKSGLIDIKEFLDSELGQQFQQAVTTLNAGRTKRPAHKDVEKALRVYKEVMDDNDRRKMFARATSFAASVYLFTSTFAEHLDLNTHAKVWAKKMQNVSPKDKTLRAWVKDPSDADKLITAMTDSFMKKIKKNKKTSGKKTAADSSSEGDSDDTGDSNSSPLAAAKAKKKAKKAKSSSEADSSAAATSSEDDEDQSSEEDKKSKSKAAKKTKKDDKPKDKKSKDKKKKKIASDSSSVCEEMSGKRIRDKKKSGKRVASSDGESSAAKKPRREDDLAKAMAASAQADKERKEAMYCKVSQGDAQMLAELAFTVRHEIGDEVAKGAGQFAVSRLHDVTGKLPVELIAERPSLSALVEKIAELDMASNAEAKQIVMGVISLVDEITCFYAAQQSVGAPASGSAATPAAAASNKVDVTTKDAPEIGKKDDKLDVAKESKTIVKPPSTVGSKKNAPSSGQPQKKA